MNCVYKEAEYSKSFFSGKESCFSDTSVIVPDTKSDIAKIVNVTATAFVSEAKSEDNRILVSGTTTFNVLYIGESDNAPLSSITESVPFSHVIMCDNVTSDYIALASVNTVCPSCSMINSRKIKLQADISLQASAYRQCKVSILSSAPEAQTKTDNIAFETARVICKKELTVSADADIPAGKAAISEILKHSVHITDYEHKALNNKLIIKGNALISILYLSDTNICDASVSVPFTEVVEAEGLSSDNETKVKLTVNNCTITKNTDLSGEYKMIDILLSLGVFITSYKNNTIPVVTDIYLPHGNLKSEKVAINPTFIPKEVKDSEFIKETILVANQDFIQGRVIDVFCKAGFPAFEDNENTVALLPVEATILYISDNGINSHTAKIQVMHKFSQPISWTTASVNSISYTLSGSNQIDLRACVDFTTVVFEENTRMVLSSCEELPYAPAQRASVIISFVKQGDTLWDIAKEYNIPLSDLANANALNEDSVLTIGQKLLIPR